MNDQLFAQEFAAELEAEYNSTLKCLERFNMDLFSWKPHETSMEMGYLVQLVAEIPLWMVYIINEDEIDFVTFPHIKPKTIDELIGHFKNNAKKAKEVLLAVKDGDLDAPFSLKSNGKEAFKASKRINLSSTINHLVHHRGQLTVYMRMNGIEIPSIYGPSADDKRF
jgi:uncharacterized damage-inducible protein DinB